MKKIIVFLGIIGLYFGFSALPARAAMVFQQASKQGYWLNNASGYGYYCDSVNSCSQVTRYNMSAGILTNFNGSHAFTLEEGRVIGSIKLSLARDGVIADPGHLVLWCDDPYNATDIKSSQSLKAADLDQETFKTFQFDFPEVNCRSLRGLYFDGPGGGGWYNIKIESSIGNSAANYGMGNIQYAGESGTGYEDYEPYIEIIDKETYVKPKQQVCDLGYATPEYADAGIPLPTYDYDPADGMVRFHFKGLSGYGAPFTYRRYDDYCNLVYPILWSQRGELFNHSLTTQNVTFKAKEVRDDSGNFLYYTWEAYNGDTGEFLPFDNQNINLAFSDPIISIGFFSYIGYPGYSNYFEYALFSPAVLVKDPNFQSVKPKTPVLIVPGILGTELYNGSELLWADLGRMFTDIGDGFLKDGLAMDEEGFSSNSVRVGEIIEKLVFRPFGVNIFGNLITELENSGYQRDKNLFVFPYDWRLDLIQTKEKLNDKIESIKSQTKFEKVDIVAHSMGGLLVKSYLDVYGKASVNKLVFVGTPHLGAPKAAKVLLEGDGFDIPWLSDSTMKSLSQHSPAVHELLPSPKYFSSFQGYIKPFKWFGQAPFMDYQATIEYLKTKSASNTYSFAESFFGENLQDMDFSGIDTYNIAGCKTDTISGFQLGFGNSFIGKYGRSTGDGTVPLPSSQYINIPSENKFYVKNAEHSQMPSTNGVRGLIVNILGNLPTSPVGGISNNADFCGYKGKELVWHSPVEVHVYDSSGRHTGPVENSGIEYGIPGVNYDIIDHEKFIFLPTDEGQQFSIKAIGSSQGTFDLHISELDSGNPKSTYVYNDVPVSTGTPVVFEVSSTTINNSIEVDGKTRLNSAQISGQEVNDLVPPETEVKIEGVVGVKGWYTSDVSFSLNANDDSSGILLTKIKMDEEPWREYTTFMENTSNLFGLEGLHTLYYYSVDKAGNNEEVKTLEFKIDKTPPEINTMFNTEAKDFVFTVSDNLTAEPQIACANSQCIAADEAGNKTILNFTKLKVLSGNSLVLKNILYNSAKTVFPENIFTVLYVESKGKIKQFSQAELIKKQQVFAANYNPKLNKTTIIDYSKGSLPVISTQEGIKFLQVSTNIGTIKTNIK